MIAQWVSGAAVVVLTGLSFGGVLKLSGKAITPNITPAGITIHSLTFTNDPEPGIIQDRTVDAEKGLLARWDAYISQSANGSEVKMCQGGGWWNYQGGRITPNLSIDKWTGVKGCWASLPIGEPLQACAVYSWGDQTEARACSAKFRKEKP